MVIKFRVLKQITLPLIKLGLNEEFFLRFDSEIFRAKENTKGPVGADGKMKQPPFLAHVTHLESGAKGQIIVPAVLKSDLEDSYPEGSYVGHSFLIINKGKKAGKEYNTFELAEIETEGEVAEDEKPAELTGEQRHGMASIPEGSRVVTSEEIARGMQETSPDVSPDAEPTSHVDANPTADGRAHKKGKKAA